MLATDVRGTPQGRGLLALRSAAQFRASGQVPSVFFGAEGREALVHELTVTNGFEAGNMRFFPVSPGNGLISEE
jgi:hypothetical protein